MKYKIIAISVLALALMLSGCENSMNPSRLPEGATHITDIGNRWATFEWNDRQFLFHDGGGTTKQAITELSEDK